MASRSRKRKGEDMHGRRLLALFALSILATDIALCAEPTPQQRAQAFASLPDWRGIWEAEAWTDRTAAGRPAGGMATVRAKAALSGHPPYKPDWEARYQAGLKNIDAIRASEAKRKVCSFGFPVNMESPSLFQVVVTPEETLFVFVTQDVRHVYTDGRSHPPKDELWPTRMGESVGRWEGDTLVIHTIARQASSPIAHASPLSMLSPEARFTERIRRVGKDRLENEMTIEDPVALARPWKLKLAYRRAADTDRLGNYDCLENDRNPIIDGELTIAPP
jgi:hypothetical protein